MTDSIRYLNFYELALLSQSVGTERASKMVMSRSRGPVEMKIDQETAEKMKILPRDEWVTVPLPSSKSPFQEENKKQRKQKTVKKGSLKPTKPLSDEQKEKLFGKENARKSASPEKIKNDEAPKKNKSKAKKPNKGKAPNAIRKTKKPSRL
ncbi:Oidioi.mRNA.OKI2018_I69.XSR.g16770.t1.cds [Oikopleura dioica]|uniref:Oidioi.mRNA.OKI2018_I69.XSR.g16770.t1.cds n=1 Tax=Oikopleura dioica TaxID=34765 RepID=A0ABN7SHM5_OIKDI|nr:Oidioi.mRNA.OKI2018_I69.XSR.g16770.t1.cds [Oikopleura dioica]